MENLQIFNYNDTPVSFQMGESDLMINATQMAKPFGKQVYDYLRLPSTNELIKAIARKSRISENQLVTKRQGSPSSGGGTWMHEDLAIDFAQWLSVDFRLWVNDRIKELFRFGLTATEDMLLRATTDPGFVAIVIDELKRSRLKTIELETKHEQLIQQIEENAPKVAFYEQLKTTQQSFEKRRNYPVSNMARTLGLKADELNRLLMQRGIIGKLDGSWYLMPKYENQGLAFEKETMSKRYNEETDKMELMPTKYLVWTAKGRDLIFSLFEKQ